MNKLSWVKRQPWVLVIPVFIATYWFLPFVFFQQDEWMVFGQHIFRANDSCLEIQRPFTCILNNLLIKLFGFSSTYYGIFNLIVGSGIVVSLYWLLRLWQLRPWQATSVAIIFSLLASGSQALTWFGASAASLPSYLFSLLTLCLLITTIRLPSWPMGLITAACYLVALYFKEEALWVLPAAIVLVPAYSLAFKLPFNVRRYSLLILPILLPSILFFLGEVLRQLESQAFTEVVSTTRSDVYFIDVLKTIFILPLIHVSHVVLPSDFFIIFSDKLPVSVTPLSIVLTILFLLGGLFLILRQPVARYILVWSIFWLLSAFLPYAVFGKTPEFLEGRYYFVASAAVAILLFMSLLFYQTRPRWIRLLWSGLIVFILVLNFYTIQQQGLGLLSVSKQRKQILSFMQEKIVSLPSKSVIYTETPHYGYAGSNQKILPFQSGLGYTLQVLFHGRDQDYRPLLSQRFLWGWLDQGYKEAHNVGFGYFYNYETLNKAVTDNQIPINSVYGFRYEDKVMTDITAQLRGRLGSQRLTLQTVSPSGWSISSNEPEGVDSNHTINKVIDGNPKTDWLVSQTHGTYVEVDFDQPIDNVASITLTMGDGNSYPAKYRFEASVDGKNWSTDFIEYARPEGLQLELYFSPQTIKKFRITQLNPKPTIFGWSVAEITVSQLYSD